MLKIFSTLLVLIIFLGSNDTKAQSRRMNNDGSMLDRSIGSRTRYNTPVKKTPTDIVKTTVDQDFFISKIVKK